MQNHNHNSYTQLRGKKLILTIFLNLLITIAQVTGALFANSLSLLSDAFHNFSDTSSLLLSYIANRLTRRKSTKKQTFGYKRAEIIAAFINSSILLIVAVLLIYESIERIIYKPESHINGILVMSLAAFSIIANGVSVLILKDEARSNMNIRSSYLHLFTDMLSSIAVLLGGIAIHFFNFYIIDPILSIAIAIYLMIFGWKLVIQSLRVLMQFTPPGMDLVTIAHDLSDFKEVKSIHHGHLWQLTDNEYMFEAHIDFEEDLSISEACKIMQKMRIHLRNRYQIHHTTFQPEFNTSCKSDLIYQDKIDDSEKHDTEV
jgi:cobalt-zinc-cadmium efflux system protein